MIELEDYIESGLDAGCPVDQLANFARAGITLQPTQLSASAAARSCDLPDGPIAIGYGGARGGGKSNLENFEDLRRRLFYNLDHEFAASRGTLTFANGSRIISGHFQNEKDIDAYLGLEYDVIGIEEATTLTSRKHQDITTCCQIGRASCRERV